MHPWPLAHPWPTLCLPLAHPWPTPGPPLTQPLSTPHPPLSYPLPTLPPRQGPGPSPWRAVLSCLHLLRTPRLLLLSLAFLYSGLQTSFWAGAFPAAISFTLGLGPGRKVVMGLCSVLVPLGSILMASSLVLARSWVNRVGRVPVVAAGLVIHTLAFGLCLVFLPHAAPLGDTEEQGLAAPRVEVLVAASLLLGAGDAALNTQVYSILSGAYRERSAEAFALMKLVQSVGIAGGFALFTSTGLRWHLLVLQVAALASTLAFRAVEVRVRGEEGEAAVEQEMEVCLEKLKVEGKQDSHG